ncbi:MAG: AAA family ATPase [Planctomycetota bacterium]|nr:AAA family ATPase [Planctomycetota bacterium]
MRLVALAGLPGTGKSALAKELAAALGAPVFDKDVLRRELFGAQAAYSPEQNDAAVRKCHEAARAAFAGGASDVILDGRTYARREQVEALRSFAREVGAALVLVELRCEAEVAKRRIEVDRERGAHLAPDRSSELYERLARLAEPLEAELVLDSTSLGPEELARRVVEHLRGPMGAGGRDC